MLPRPKVVWLRKEAHTFIQAYSKGKTSARAETDSNLSPFAAPKDDNDRRSCEALRTRRLGPLFPPRLGRRGDFRTKLSFFAACFPFLGIDFLWQNFAREISRVSQRFLLENTRIDGSLRFHERDPSSSFRESEFRGGSQGGLRRARATAGQVLQAIRPAGVTFSGVSEGTGSRSKLRPRRLARREAPQAG